MPDLKLPKSASKPRLDRNSPPRPEDLDAIPEQEHPTRTTRYLNRFVLGMLILAFMGLGLMLKWAITDNQPLVVKNSPFPTRSVRPSAEANGVIILTVDYCKNTDKQGEVRTSFVSKSREIFLPVSREQYDKGCFKQEIPVLIPEDLPAGDYKLKFTATYDLNPLKQNQTVMFESQEFHVNPLGTEGQILDQPKEQ